MNKWLIRLGILLLIAGVAGAIVWLARPRVRPLPPTVADLSAVHASVMAAGAQRIGVHRLSDGDTVETDAEGRARVRLDDGTSCLVDRDTKLVVKEKSIAIERGRVFVIAPPGALAELSVGPVTARLSAASAGVERRDGGARIYAPNEEITVSAGGIDHKVRPGESAVLKGDALSVEAEKAFDDWTGGLAAPWGAGGAPRRTVGELWARSPGQSPGDPASPLTIRALDVSAEIMGESARTRVTATYFNGGSNAAVGTFRMALPTEALVSRFAWGKEDALREATIALAARNEVTLRPDGSARLEWAGEGFVLGHIPQVASGEAVQIVIEYVEWLPVRQTADGDPTVQWRLPLAAPGEAPLIGEFSAKVDAGRSRPVAIAPGFGAKLDGASVSIRRPDFRPIADLVVDVTLPPFESTARLYAAPAAEGEDAQTVMVRAEVPPAPPDVGATLALVLDTSGSAEAGALETARAFVGALLDALGARDRVVVIAADQDTRFVGPNELGPLDAARKKAILGELEGLSPGGATDLGRALEAGANTLPDDAAAAMVVYVGDGWATLGDANQAQIQARLSRRAGGAPRLGAVAVGALANASLLANLSRGSGPMLTVHDRGDAAAAAVELVQSALSPAVQDVELEFGPEVERVYPRAPRTVLAGATLSAVGRVRGPAPNAVVLRYRDAKGVHEERRLLALRAAVDPADVRRRWAAARVDEVLSTGRGREAATDVALAAGLLTPWTALADGDESYVPTLLTMRWLGESLADAFALTYAQPPTALGALSSETSWPVDDVASDEALREAVARAAARIVGAASSPVRACRESRAALRPELAGALSVTLSVDGEGRASDVSVKGTSPQAEDAALSRCIEVALSALSYPKSGLTVKIRVDTTIVLPAPQPITKVTCSSLSTMPLAHRRGVWRARLDDGTAAVTFLAAKRTCELPNWSARRALLELILSVVSDGVERVKLARELESAGEEDAATFLRREAVRRAVTPDELSRVRSELLGDERYPWGAFEKRYKAAASDKARLDVVRRFLTIAPHDTRLRRKLIALLETLGEKATLAEEARSIRSDPFADAELLGDAASALLRTGNPVEARRTFGEIAERAPTDPWARALLGDRLRNQGLFDEATRAYAVLETLAPDEPAATLRLALAHAGAGRLDITRRLLTRVTETGGRTGDAQLGALAGHVAGVLLARAAEDAKLSAPEAAKLRAARLELPRPERQLVLLVRGPAASRELGVRVTRKVGDARESVPVEIAAASLGLYAITLDMDSIEVELELTRPEELPPAPAMPLEIDTLIPNGASEPPRRSATRVELAPSGKPTKLRWRDGAWAS